MHGQGVFTFSDGRHYQGEFKDGSIEGFGVFTYSNGTRYEGFWINNRANG